MSSCEDFDSSPEVRRFVGEVSQTVCSYMFEPLARSTVTQNVKIDSDSAESSDSCLRLWDGHTIACGDANKDQQNADSAQDGHGGSQSPHAELEYFFSIGNFCKEVTFGV